MRPHAVAVSLGKEKPAGVNRRAVSLLINQQRRRRSSAATLCANREHSDKEWRGYIFGPGC